MATSLNVSAWSTTAASNDGADSTIGTVANTSSPTNVDDWVKGVMAAVKKYVLDTDGGLTSSGTNTITITTNRSISSSHQAAGFSLRFKAGGTNTGAATLNVDSLGAVAIQRQNGDALSAGDIVSGGIYDVAFDGTNYKLIGANAGATGFGSLTGSNTWSGTNVFQGSTTVGDGSGDTVVIKGTTVNSFMSATLSSANVAAFVAAVGLASGATTTVGTAATQNTGTSGANVPLMNGANTWSAGQSFNGTGTGNTASFTATQANTGTGVVDVTAGVGSVGNSRFLRFIVTGSEIGSITTPSGSGVAFNTTSDGRLKPSEHRRPITDSGEIVDALNPIYFRWHDGTEDFGFVAQEAYAVSPFLALPGEGEPGDEGFSPWTMEKGRMEAIHTAELQSLRRRVAALERA